MKTLFQRVKSHKFITALFIFGVICVGYYFTRPPKAPNYETVTVVQGTVLQEVSVTGRVNAESEVDLAFERGGRVSSDPRSVGTRVKGGDVLVRLDSSELVALREQALANVEYEKANLAQLKNGARSEDIAVTEAGYASAVSTLQDAKIALSDKLSSASTAADDAIFNKTDYLFDNPRSGSPRALFLAADQKLVTRLEQDRAALSLELKQMTLIEVDFEGGLEGQKKYFSDVKNYLDNLASAINAVLVSSQTPQSTIDTWKANVSVARTNVNTAVSALLAAEQSYRSAGAALNIAENQLRLKKAGATTEALAAQQAKIAAVVASIANYDAQIAKTAIRAPFAGIITKQDAKAGQTVTPNIPVVSLMSDTKFQIEANVPEVDVAKIAVGDSARVTLDAYGADAPFDAVVGRIDPAETVLEGVSTYKVTLFFVRDDPRIRSGMTANIDISTDKKEGVLYIPLRAVSTKDGKKYVRVPNGSGQQEIEVVLGLRGSNGTVEVQQGLTLGQSVITFAP